MSVAWEIACEVGRPALESYLAAVTTLREIHRESRRRRA